MCGRRLGASWIHNSDERIATRLYTRTRKLDDIDSRSQVNIFLKSKIRLTPNAISTAVSGRTSRITLILVREIRKRLKIFYTQPEKVAMNDDARQLEAARCRASRSGLFLITFGVYNAPHAPSCI